MTQIEELQRKALLHRQGATLLREESKRHDEAARQIDGELSQHEKTELHLRLEWLLGLFRQGALEYRLARLGATR